MFRFLRFWFDTQMTWVKHIESSCQQKENIECDALPVRNGVGGAYRMEVKMLYIALLRSVMDYGSIAYGSAAQTSLKKPDVIQAQALRICCGTLRTSPVAAMQVELGEMPLRS